MRLFEPSAFASAGPRFLLSKKKCVPNASARPERRPESVRDGILKRQRNQNGLGRVETAGTPRIPACP